MSQPQGRAPSSLLITAFEPSGDDHASAVIAELKRRDPSIQIYAWGGDKMEAAGATIVERTGSDAVMGMPGLKKIREHKRINKRIDAWLDQHDVGVHVPVDSPAANFPVCKIAKAHGVKVIHLVAPQLWAWAEWRIKKLRRLSNGVLCLLPFEEDWFLSRGVKARFIGHPLFDRPLDSDDLDRRAARIEQSGSPKIALMPGSRPGELRSAFPILLDAFRRLRKDVPEAAGVIVATRESVAEHLRERAQRLGGWPEGLDIIAGDTDAAVRWCDFALVVSGTVTLQIARQTKPMVTFYRPNKLVYYLLGKWLVSTKYFTLPNLIARKRVVPEFIPHFGNGEELALEVIRLMRRPGYADDQRAQLAEIARLFDGFNAASGAADAIQEALASTGAAQPTVTPA